MKIPESIRIAGVEYEIKLVPNLNNGTNLAYGYIDYENSVISLSETNGAEHQRRCQILWHEILHGIRENNGMEIENEEAVVDMFARGIYQVLQDNGARLFDLKKGGADDVVEVVRCKDCVFREESQGACDYCKLHDCRFCENGFCSYGKRKE